LYTFLAFEPDYFIRIGKAAMVVVVVVVAGEDGAVV
jgi:hypothetical protein